MHGPDLRDFADKVDLHQDLAFLLGEGEPDAVLLLTGDGGPLPQHVSGAAPGGGGQKSVQSLQGRFRLGMKGPIGFES